MNTKNTNQSKQTLLILQGIPGSGKSTYAESLVKNDKEHKWVRVNRDSLRQMFGFSPTNFNNEVIVSRAELDIIDIALFYGNSVIVDDVNLNPKTIATLENIVDEQNKKYSCKIEIDTHLIPVKLSDAISRDKQRQKSVGEKIIRMFTERYPDAVLPE